MEDNKMYMNIVDGDVYDFTYKVKEYEIVEKHYEPTISNKSINITIECCFEEDKSLREWVREYAEECTGRSKLVYATGHQHIVVRSGIDVLCDFDKCKLLYIDVKEDNELILTFSIYNDLAKADNSSFYKQWKDLKILDGLCGNLDGTLTELYESEALTIDKALIKAANIIGKELLKQATNKTINDRDLELLTKISMFIVRLEAKELDEYKELPFKIGDEVMVDYTDIETGELKSIESKIHDIYMIYDIFTSKPEIIVTVTNDFCHNEQIGDWRKYIKVK